jgi:hypothetical protein
MATQLTIHYELSSLDDLNQLSLELPDTDAGTFIVAFDSSSGWSPTDLEIARLVASARTAGKRLFAESRSGAAAERAVLLGFVESAIVTDDPALSDRATTVIQTASEAPTTILKAGDRYTSTANLATYRPPDRDITFTWHGRGVPVNLVAGAALKPLAGPITWRPISSSTRVSAPSTPGSPGMTSAAETATSPQLAPGGLRKPTRVQNSSDSDSGKRAEEILEPTRPRRFGKIRIAVAMIALLLTLGAAAAMAAYYLPEADVLIVPREESVTSRLTYGVAVPGTNVDIAIDPSPISITLTAEATRSSTGERFEPAGVAGGILQITNALPSEVTVPAGTEFPGANGIMYYSSEDVRIPPADPFGSRSFGAATVGVYAGVTGPDGNLSAGGLTGQIGSDLFYTNPEGFGGGRMDRFATISEGDVEAIREDVAAQLLDTAEREFLAQAPSELEILPGSLTIGDPEIEVEGEANQDGDMVSAAGQITVKALAFDPNELHELAGSEADRLLARQGRSDRILLAETVRIDEPASIDEDGLAYEITVRAVARIVITEAEREEIANAIAGMSQGEAESYLAGNPKIARHSVQVDRSWLFDRMPQIASRINVQVSSGEQTASIR